MSADILYCVLFATLGIFLPPVLEFLTGNGTYSLLLFYLVCAPCFFLIVIFLDVRCWAHTQTVVTMNGEP